MLKLLLVTCVGLGEASLVPPAPAAAPRTAPGRCWARSPPCRQRLAPSTTASTCPAAAGRDGSAVTLDAERDAWLCPVHTRLNRRAFSDGEFFVVSGGEVVHDAHVLRFLWAGATAEAIRD